jgi:hypothetical protein
VLQIGGGVVRSQHLGQRAIRPPPQPVHLPEPVLGHREPDAEPEVGRRAGEDVRHPGLVPQDLDGPVRCRLQRRFRGGQPPRQERLPGAQNLLRADAHGRGNLGRGSFATEKREEITVGNGLGRGSQRTLHSD